MQTDLVELMYDLVDRTLKMSKEAGYPRIGILMIMDSELVEVTTLEDLQRMLFDIRERVDAHNLENGTNYYSMVALCTYSVEQKYRHSDAQIASANAMFCAFNSFLGRRATFDLNRYLLDREEGRLLCIRGENDWRVNPEMFEDGRWSMDTLCMWYEKLIDFLSEEDGLRCKYDDLTFPYKTNKKGIISFLPTFKVASRIRDNVCNIDVKAIGDPEELYWLRFRLLQEGKDESQVPALPSLNLSRYTFLPKESGQVAEECAELEDPRKRQKATRRREKDAQREERKQLRKYRRSLLQMVTRGRLETDDSLTEERATDDE